MGASSSTRGCQIAVEDLPGDEGTRLIQQFMHQMKLINNFKCLICGKLPDKPVTNVCGHTICFECLPTTSACTCPCGTPYPPHLNINIFIRDLTLKMYKITDSTTENTESDVGSFVNQEPVELWSALNFGAAKSRRPKTTQRYVPYTRRPSSPPLQTNPRVAEYASKELLQISQSSVQSFRNDVKCVLGDVEEKDLECLICCIPLTNPVTMPCGHLCCRSCIDRIVRETRKCPLCCYSLQNFSLNRTADTEFVRSLKQLYDMETIPNDRLLLFRCTVAFPTIPCPLLIFKPRCWKMVKKVIDSDKKVLGIVNCDSKKYRYGTMLEIRDCVLFEDGRVILSTVGVSRFEIIRREITPEGCCFAKVIEFRDDTPIEPLAKHYQLAHSILIKKVEWWRKLSVTVKESIKNEFGEMPSLKPYFTCWQSAHGPDCLWWLIAILPVDADFKTQMLSMKSLYNRMIMLNFLLDMILRSGKYERVFPITHGPYIV